MGNHGVNKGVKKFKEIKEVKEVVESQVFEISYSYNSSIATYTYIKNYDEKYLEKVNGISRYHGEEGMTGCSTSKYVYFKAKKPGTTEIILGHNGEKNENTSIKVIIKENDGKTPIEKIEFKKEKQYRIPNKICLLGDAKVGKTTIINYLNGQGFDDEYVETITPIFIKKKINYQNEEVELTFWDTIGNQKFRVLNKLFYKDSEIIIFVYDITNKNSFESIKNIWYEDVQEYCEKKPMILIFGNKSDLYLEEEIREEDVSEYAKSINAKLKIVSAKTACLGHNFLEELIDDYQKFRKK